MNKIETKQCMRLSYYFLKTFIPSVLKKYKVYVFVHDLITVSLVHITCIMYCMIYKMS